MKKIIFSIGIPGTGKSTVLKKFAEKYGYDYVCPDDIRQEINGDPKSQANMSQVWETAYARLKNGINHNRNVVFDSTMARQIDRENFLRFAQDSGAEKIQGLYFQVPLNLAKERNASRGRVVPEFVLDRMYNALNEQPPSSDEGIHSLFIMNEDGGISRIERINSIENQQMIERERPSSIE